MHLIWHRSEHQLAVTGIEGTRVRLGDTWHGSSLWVDPTGAASWRPRSLEDLLAEDLEPLIARAPALLLLGTGATLRFPAAALRAQVLGRGIGLECMDNAAAARTFNVLLGEDRSVLAAFLIAEDD